MLTHDPDGRQLDSELLLHLVENVICSTLSDVSDAQSDANINVGSIDMIGSDEPLGCTIYKISHEILYRCFEQGNLHTKTMVLLEMVSHFRWDAKVVLVLAAFTTRYGIFWLIQQLHFDNVLALSLAILKRFPRDIMFDPKFKALISLINCLVKVTKLVEMMASLPVSHDHKAMATMNSNIYMATYWIIRSILECTSQITDPQSVRHEQVSLNAKIVAAWTLYSLGNKLNSLCHDLEEQIDTSLQAKLLTIFKEKHTDNQEVLHTLFSCKVELPFKDHSSQKKVDIFELKNKIVILLISKPELLPLDKLLFLVQQTYDHPKHKQIEENYAILWVPIPSANEWSLDEKRIFEVFSSSLPWFSVRQPWTLNSAVVNFIKQEWKLKEEPLMVVLDVNGMVTNSNAMDMVWIWGAKAFPFSISREKELWEKEKWSLELMTNGISPLLTNGVEEGRNLCIFGSENIDWIREFTAKMKKIKDAGIRLQLVYVGCRNSSNQTMQNILNIINQEQLSISLTSEKIHFFWFRLENIKSSIIHQENTDKIAKEVAEFLDFGENKEGWAVLGRGSSTDVIKLSVETVAELGFLGATEETLKTSFPSEPCNHTDLVPYEEGLIERSVNCGVCKRPMKKFVVYKCDVAAE
ncbi:unnamed protein product [Fraxinus pennsylvanica]|uniref:Protein SIEVE ELEMENT OCCLUSION C n=1 Tax=Fraxinus pennsylvanica TaxID=56036 RepID=A0AAD2ABJ1_9LAMI|nr:unnamed protein product [Fraxinus pennsylvanica]